jgi:glycosyltransferase involved in cell wall biosynthesis
MIRILVIMSTWNGQNFLRDQLDSIKNQSFQGEVAVLIRDDGSTDNTIEIIENYKNLAINIIYGRNIGAKDSFLELIELAKGIEADYYALADQDDYWYPDKLQVAVDKLKDQKDPALYCGSVELVDENLKHLSIYTHPECRSFQEAILYNCATGCTSVFNRALLMKILSPNKTNKIIMHDWWIALIAISHGKIVYDKFSHIKYRQHSANHVGIVLGIKGFFYKIQKIFNYPRFPSRKTQVEVFYETYSDKISENYNNQIRLYLHSSDSIFRRIIYIYNFNNRININAAIKFILFP